MESKVIYSRYTLFPVGLCNSISCLYCCFFQCKGKFKNVTANSVVLFQCQGGWCVVRVFQLFVIFFLVYSL